MAHLQKQVKIVSESLPVEKIYHPFVCGPNNAIIKKLTEETGARIKVPPPRVLKDEIMVSGNKDGVNKCKATIMSIYLEKKHKCQTVSVQVRKFQHKYVIGSHGSYLQEILAKTGVSVEVPFHESPSETITLRGEQAKLGLALKMVYSKTNGVIEAVVNAPERLHKFLIGKKGENIRRITQDCPKVLVEFLRGKDKIQVKGPHNEVMHAVAALQDNINKLLINETGKRRILIGEVSHKSDPRSYHCNVCKKKFSTKSGMKKHKRHHKEVRPWNFVLVKRFCKKTGVMQYERHQEDYQHNVFSVCQKGDSRKGKSWLHLYHKDFRRYDCNICDEEHLTRREPWQHLRHQKDFRYSLRDEGYSKRKETCQHLHPHKDISTYQCEICGKEFSTKTEMKEHRRHKDIRPYQCHTCDNGYSTQRDLWQHLRVHKDYRCSKCNDFDEEYPEKMQRRLYFSAYEGKHSSLVKLMKDKIKEDFPLHSVLSFHSFIHQESLHFRPIETVVKSLEAMGYGRPCKKFTLYEIGGFQEILLKTEKRKPCKSCQCKFCRKRFSRNNEPEQDKKTHNACDSSTLKQQTNVFIKGSNFRIPEAPNQQRREPHMVYDAGHYQCDICGKKFSTKKGMKDHKRHYVDIRHYRCDVCGKIFSKKIEMEEHRENHADFRKFRPYQCDICSERFFTKNEMGQHKRHHKDNKAYQCDICGKKFTTKRRMEQHRQHHYGSIKRQ